MAMLNNQRVPIFNVFYHGIRHGGCAWRCMALRMAHGFRGPVLRPRCDRKEFVEWRSERGGEPQHFLKKVLNDGRRNENMVEYAV